MNLKKKTRCRNGKHYRGKNEIMATEGINLVTTVNFELVTRWDGYNSDRLQDGVGIILMGFDGMV